MVADGSNLLPAPRLGKPVHWTWGPGRWSVHPREAPPKVDFIEKIMTSRWSEHQKHNSANKYQHVSTYIPIYIIIILYYIILYFHYIYILSYNTPKTMTNATHTNIQTSKKIGAIKTLMLNSLSRLPRLQTAGSRSRARARAMRCRWPAKVGDFNESQWFLGATNMGIVAEFWDFDQTLHCCLAKMGWHWLISTWDFNFQPRIVLFTSRHWYFNSKI